MFWALKLRFFISKVQTELMGARQVPRAVAGAECNTVIELTLEHHAA
jgi:hypothetical protein